MKLPCALFLSAGFLLASACQPQAGKSAETEFQGTPRASIIGGTSAAPQEFPFLVNIWQNSPKDGFVAHLCGGSLVGRTWVLTAAHCVLEDVSDKSQGTVKLRELVAYIDSNDINGKGGRALALKSIYIHPDFSWPHHDVALIELAESVNDVVPVTLNQKDLGNSSVPQFATVAGWGLVDSQGKIEGAALQKVNVPLVDRQTCAQDPYLQSKNWKIGPETLCAQTSLNQKASCQGDSGGPLFQVVDGHYLQIGIVSWGSACREFLKNNKSNVEGYADVADAFDWIQSLISRAR